jgi:hypothetical protein
MLRLADPSVLIVVLDSLTRREMYLSENENRQLIDEDYNSVKTLLDLLRPICVSGELSSSLRAIDDFLRELEIDRAKYPKHYFISGIRKVRSALQYELEDRTALVLEIGKAKYYEQEKAFGEDVFIYFTSAGYDIEEANNCFAISRYTACVMHLQRVIEVGLKSFGLYLGIYSNIRTAQPSWHTVLGLTGAELDRRTVSRLWATNEEKEYANGIQTFLVAVKTAWRNPSMHADKQYDGAKAKRILDATKHFMEHLAEHLNEKGKFTKTRRKKNEKES